MYIKENSYVSCFLRPNHSAGVISETGGILATPELISDISNLYRPVANPKPTEYNSDNDESSSSGPSGAIIVVGNSESCPAATMIA